MTRREGTSKSASCILVCSDNENHQFLLQMEVLVTPDLSTLSNAVLCVFFPSRSGRCVSDVRLACSPLKVWPALCTVYARSTPSGNTTLNSRFWWWWFVFDVRPLEQLVHSGTGRRSSTGRGVLNMTWLLWAD